MVAHYDTGAQKNNIEAVLTLLAELKADLNALRADFLNHDHGATYNAFVTRMNTTTNSVTGSGSLTSTTVDAPNAASPLLGDDLLD